MAFVPHDTSRRKSIAKPLHAAGTSTVGVALDEDVQRQLAKARALLDKANEKLESKDKDPSDASQATANSEVTPKPPAPFFFASYKEPQKRQQVVKSVNENGLITTDGEKMASLSESESWEIRALDDVFDTNEAVVSSMAGRTLNEKDLATNIMYLRKQLQDADFSKIFDQRNRFIGDLD